jgi:hypothetical protein
MAQREIERRRWESNMKRRRKENEARWKGRQRWRERLSRRSEADASVSDVEDSV